MLGAWKWWRRLLVWEDE